MRIQIIYFTVIVSPFSFFYLVFVDCFCFAISIYIKYISCAFSHFYHSFYPLVRMLFFVSAHYVMSDDGDDLYNVSSFF